MAEISGELTQNAGMFHLISNLRQSVVFFASFHVLHLFSFRNSYVTRLSFFLRCHGLVIVFCTQWHRPRSGVQYSVSSVTSKSVLYWNVKKKNLLVLLGLL